MQRQIYFIKKKMIDCALRFRFQRGLQEREGKKKQQKTNWNPQRKILKVFFSRQVSVDTLQQWLSRFPSMCESKRAQKLQVDCGDFKLSESKSGLKQV